MTSPWGQPLYFADMRSKIIRRLVKLTPILLVSVFVGMQFVSTPAVSKTSAAGPHRAEMIDPQVGKILDRSCQDCHSSRVGLPWYGRVAPLSWYISKHIVEGREVLDFSEWATRAPSDNERMLICDAISDDSMPLSDYTAIHRKARLSKQDVKLICGWAATSSTPMMPTEVGKLANNNM